MSMTFVLMKWQVSFHRFFYIYIFELINGDSNLGIYSPHPPPFGLGWALVLSFSRLWDYFISHVV